MIVAVPADEHVAAAEEIVGTAGTGLTVTVTVCAVPTQPFNVGVTVYVTVCTEVVKLVKVLLNVEVVCVVVDSPLTLAFALATHVNVEPDGFDVKGILTVWPLQIVAVVALVITGGGLIVTVVVT